MTDLARSRLTFLPVIERELLVAARRTRTYWSRVAAGGLAFLVGFSVLQPHLVQRLGVAAVGYRLFGTLTWAAFIVATLAGVLATADSLSREKREGTLGLLFLTDLRGPDVVLGKLTAAGLKALYSLLTVVPILAFSLLLGGVSVFELCRVALVLVVTTLLSLSAGLLASAGSRASSQAHGLALVLVLLALGGLPLLAHVAATLRTGQGWLATFDPTLSGPLGAIRHAFAAGYRSPAGPSVYWSACVSMLLLAVLMLLGAGALVRRTLREKLSAPEIRWRERWWRWSFGGSASRRSRLRRLLDDHPTAWLSLRNRMKGFYLWGCLALLAVLWLGLHVFLMRSFPRGMLDAGLAFATILIFNLVVKLLVASESGVRFAEDRRNGALELLLRTKLADTEILYGHCLGLVRRFGGAILVVLAVDLAITLYARSQFYRQLDYFDYYFYLVPIGVFLADLPALAFVGMWVGLRSRNHVRAFGAATMRILIVPGLLLFWVSFDISDFNQDLPPVYLTISLIADVVFGLVALNRLQTEFRRLANQPYYATAFAISPIALPALETRG